MVVEENDFIVRSINCFILAILSVREFPVSLGLAKLKCVWSLTSNKSQLLVRFKVGRDKKERVREERKKMSKTKRDESPSWAWLREQQGLRWLAPGISLLLYPCIGTGEKWRLEN